MGLAIWSYLRTREGVFRRYPATAFQRFRERMAPVQVSVVNDARFVELIVQLEDRRPGRVHRVDFPKFRIDEDGYRHPADVSERDANSRIIAASVIDSVFEAENDVYDLVPRIAQRRLAEEYHWKASSMDVQALCKTVNGRAQGEILHHVGTQLRFL